jgi:tetratricopeptide (TPR) repeat protein
MDPAGEAAARDAVAVAERLGDPDLLSVALDGLAWWPSSRGQFGEGYRITQRRIDLVPRLTNLREIADSYTLGAWNASRLGLYAKAIEYATAVLQWPEMEPAALEHATAWSVFARFMSGDWDGALADQQEIERFMQEDPRGLPIHGQLQCCGVMAFCHELRGDRPAAERYLEVVRRVRELNLVPPQRMGAFAHAARALARQGRTEEAIELLPLAERNSSSGALLEALCDVLAEQGDWDTGREILLRARDEAAECELLALPRFADRLEGRMRADPELLCSSAQGFASLGAQWEEAWSRLLLAELTGNPADLGTALDTFDRLGSVQEIERAQAVAEKVSSA